MDPAAKTLMKYMLDISEKAYHTGWVDHLEYVLWYAVVNGPMAYGHYQITEEDISTLRKLSYSCEGWIYFNESIGESWVPINEWQDIFTKNVEFVRLRC